MFMFMSLMFVIILAIFKIVCEPFAHRTVNETDLLVGLLPGNRRSRSY
jgi:hypothetical protein